MQQYESNLQEKIDGLLADCETERCPCHRSQVIQTKAQLFKALGQNGCEMVSVNGVIGVLLGVDRDDGSGTRFEVKMLVHNRPTTVHFTCRQ